MPSRCRIKILQQSRRFWIAERLVECVLEPHEVPTSVWRKKSHLSRNRRQLLSWILCGCIRDTCHKNNGNSTWTGRSDAVLLHYWFVCYTVGCLLAIWSFVCLCEFRGGRDTFHTKSLLFLYTANNFVHFNQFPNERKNHFIFCNKHWTHF